jgi:nucleotide-binding universal stress UspA family protein
MTGPIRRIIAPLIPGQEEAPLRWAGRLARDFGASADAAYVRQDERLAALSFGSSDSAYAARALMEELRKAQRDAENAARAALEKVRDESPGLSFGRFLALEEANGGLARAARCYDLAVTLLPGDATEYPRMALLSRLVLEAGVPVFAVPEELAFDRPLANVMLAWDGSREAGRAMRAAVPLLRRAKTIEIVHLGPPGTDHDLVGAAASYLEAHEVAVDATRHQPAALSEGATLLALAASSGADLVVMGAYGHPRWMERALGGATLEVVRKCPSAVLLAH